MKAMILAAGLGTRLRPLTNDTPKALIKYKGTPLIEMITKKLIESGFDEIVINVHHLGEQIIDFFQSKNNFGISIQFSDESEQLLNTGGALKKAAPLLGNQPFLVHNVDIISSIDLRRLFNFHVGNEALATLAVKERPTSRQLVFDPDYYLAAWKNTATGEIKLGCPHARQTHFLAFSGIHVVSPQLIDLMTESGKFSIIDVYLRLAATQPIKGYRHNEDTWLDAGKKENLA